MLLDSIRFAPSSTALLMYIIVTNSFTIADKVLFFKENCRFSVSLTRTSIRNIFILFWNICTDIAFSRSLPLKTVIQYANPEKAIVDATILLNLPATVYLQSGQVSKCSKLNFLNKFTIVTKNIYNHSYNHMYNF